MVGLLVGWTLISATPWLLVVGISCAVFVIIILLLFGSTLAVRIVELRRQSRFIDSVTHELKSPLASMRLCLEALTSDTITDYQRQDLREMISRDVERLTTFIDDVIESNRLDATESGTSSELVFLLPLIERCSQKVGYTWDTRTITVEVADDCAVLSDSILLEIVLKNIIDNGCKYSGAGDVVTVSVQETAEREIVITVTDKGIGIAAADLKRVTRRFYRSSSKLVRMRHGTGLGLYVAKYAARRLGGRLIVTSKGIDQGTKVQLILDKRSHRSNATEFLPSTENTQVVRHG